MFRPHFRVALCSIVCLVAAFVASTSFAHFLWVKTIEQDGKPQAFLFFGENTSDEAYHMPESLLKTQLWHRGKDGKRVELKTEHLETDDRVGLVAPVEAISPCVVETTKTYGIYGKALLTYYAKHISAATTDELNAAGASKDLKLDIIPRIDGKNLQLTVLWDGKPLPQANVAIHAGDDEPTEKETNDKGQVEFPYEADKDIGVLANFIEKDATGKHDGKDYTSVMNYASLTLGKSKAAKGESKGEEKSADADKSEKTAKGTSALTPLPEPVSSFGAAASDGWLYVYSGHTGGEHEHSAKNLSQNFRRIKLDGTGEWEELPMQQPLQGLALVAHGGKLYRIGGLNARNATTDEDEDLHSSADFTVFDPASSKWESLAPLPAPRSSHNAVVIDGKLYVAGGWHLHGKSPGDWQPDALVFDFAKPEAGWQKLPQPPFKRRAIAIGNWQGKLVVIGGMNEKGRVSPLVDIYDPKSNTWTEGPKLPGSGLMAFGGAACDINGEIYVTGLKGVVYRLNEDGSQWEEATRMATGRFFHQMVPAADGRLFAIGGASREGHLEDIEAIELGKDTPKPNGT